VVERWGEQSHSLQRLEREKERESVERGDSARLNEKRRTAARRLGEEKGEERAVARRAEGKIQKEKARVFTFHRF
jgi:hypothetical protein